MGLPDKESLKFFLGGTIICVSIGGGISYFTDAKWLAASLWVFAAMYINGSLAIYEDDIPGGFNNPDGDDTPSYAKGFGAFKFWVSSLGTSLFAVWLGWYVQSEL